MSDPKIDALFEKMPAGMADKMTGTHPPKPKAKKNKVAKKGKK